MSDEVKHIVIEDPDWMSPEIVVRARFIEINQDGDQILLSRRGVRNLIDALEEFGP